MRVAFITHYTELYGANRSLLNLIEGLGKYGVYAHVISPKEGELNEVLRNLGIPVVTIPIQLWMSNSRLSRDFPKLIMQYIQCKRSDLVRLYRNLQVLSTLVRQLRKWKIDIIYTNSSGIPIGVLASRWLKLPHVWHLRELSNLYGARYDWGEKIFKYTISSADALIVVSEAVRKYLLSDVSNQNIHIIYNGVMSEIDFDRLYDLVKKQQVRQQSYTFALVGLIHPNKGQETAIRALAIVANQYSNVRLLIVGGGDTSKLKQIAQELGMIDKIEFWGYIKDPYKAYLAANATLMCSRYEAMGRVTVEAMSACRPVIGYDDAGTSELIDHGYNGLLYRDGPEELAACMIQFIKDPGWASQLGENGWHVARKNYSIETCAKSTYKVLCAIKTKNSR